MQHIQYNNYMQYINNNHTQTNSKTKRTNERTQPIQTINEPYNNCIHHTQYAKYIYNILTIYNTSKRIIIYNYYIQHNNYIQHTI